MRKHFFLSWAAVLLVAMSARAQDRQATSQPVVPPDGEAAKQAIEKSPRHGEWQEIALPGSEARIRTWVVFPERKEKAPVVLVIHEIFGLTDWVRGVADQLAADGYIAVAPDMLSGRGPGGGGTEALGDKVREEIRKLSPDEVAQRLDAVRAWALQHPAASGKSASIGFCWGGTASFNYAVRQPKLDAAIVYYGSGPKEAEQLARIAAPVLGLYGGDDARVTSTVEPTKQAMKQANKPYEAHVFDGAGHGFLRQQSGKEGANQKAAQQAWQHTLAFLKQHLQ
ncbi:MAG TPA: dienelactone hydrolase family protein [Tepidisphaeraceae bacterium]|nr:dienelactone hydrolase family protein [Tepidisphaeraceae bacterium]